MKDLLEKLDSVFAGEPKQKRGDQVKGKEKMDMISPVLGADYKKHPASGRLVGAGGAAEELEESTEELAEQFRKELAEYGADGSGMSGQTMGRADYQNRENQEDAQKDQIKSQIDGLVAQIQGARSQLSSLNKAFPQGANPVEKAMSLQQTTAEKRGLKQQIAGLRAQIAQLRQQSV